MNVLIFGLGLHGGGAAAAEYFAGSGQTVRVTDRKSSGELEEALLTLKRFQNISFRFGEHDLDDVRWADIIIKNPAIRPDQAVGLIPFPDKITTDMGYCLPRLKLPMVGVTGTKGKSTAVDALRFLVNQHDILFHDIKTAGNNGEPIFRILSPDLPTIESKTENHLPDLLIIELSSWQLGDLRVYSGIRPCFQIVMITSLFPDHLNTYPDYSAYISDKLHLLTLLRPGGNIILPWKDIEPFKYEHLIPHGSKVWLFSHEGAIPAGTAGLWCEEDVLYFSDGEDSLISFSGADLRAELLPSLLAAHLLLPDVAVSGLISSLRCYPGIPYRNEVVGKGAGIMFIDDSAATVPQAVQFTLHHHIGKVTAIHLIAGGTDKALDPETLTTALHKVESLHLLAGSFTDRLIPMLEQLGIPFAGPFSSMQEAFDSAVVAARTQRSTQASDHMLPQVPASDVLVILSPGCASFGLFKHEFHRGEVFNSCVREYITGS